jgi:hypothetical protein
MAALVAGTLELVGARLARAVGLGQGTGAIGRAAGDLVHVVQAREGIGQTDDDHALVQQSRVERDDRRLLAAMLVAVEQNTLPTLPKHGALRAISHWDPAFLLEKAGLK